MPKSTLIETRTQSFGELFSNGRGYAVPRFQRDYSWQEQQWEELWEDIEAAASDADVHYMGTVVLQRSVGKSHVVIDGQQRFTTLTLVVLAAISLLERLAATEVETEANEERAKLLSERFVRSKDAASLSYQSRLTLNRASDGFFQTYLVQLKSPPAPARLPPADKALWDGFVYFQRRLQSRFAAGADGSAIARFVEADLSERLLFIEVVVDDDLRAYTLFETLNARGVELSVTDLLKNYLFALTSDSSTDLSIVQERWERILSRVPLRDFPALLRHYWNSTKPYVREQQLFKTVRRQVTTKEAAFELLQNLEGIAELHGALRNPDDPLWEQDQEIRESVRELRLFRVSQCNPLIFAAWTRLQRDEFKRVLRACVVLSLRYTVVASLNPQPLERAYNHAAMAVSGGGAQTAMQAIQALRAVYPTDETFEHAFISFSAKGGKSDVARYLLVKLEAVESGAESAEPTGTIEHILPENTDGSWSALFAPDEHAALVYRLGNLTLLEKNVNRDLGNRPFPEKRVAYAQSRYAMTRSIDNDEWSRDAIVARQRAMARRALGIWQIGF